MVEHVRSLINDGRFSEAVDATEEILSASNIAEERIVCMHLRTIANIAQGNDEASQDSQRLVDYAATLDLSPEWQVKVLTHLFRIDKERAATRAYDFLGLIGNYPHLYREIDFIWAATQKADEFNQAMHDFNTDPVKVRTRGKTSTEEFIA